MDEIQRIETLLTATVPGTPGAQHDYVISMRQLATELARLHGLSAKESELAARVAARANKLVN